MPAKQLVVKFSTDGLPQTITEIRRANTEYDQIAKTQIQGLEKAKIRLKELAAEPVVDLAAVKKQTAAVEAEEQRLARTVSAAFRELGVQSGAEIEGLKNRAIAAFEAIQKNGVASAKEVERAELALQKRLEALDGQLDRTQESAGGFGKILGTLKGAFLGAVAASAAYAALDIAKEFVASSAAAQQLQVRLERVTGSQQNAAKQYKDLQALADRYGLEIDGLTQAYNDLRRSTNDANIPAEKANQLFRDITLAGRAAGIETGTLNGAIVQLGQGLGSGVLRGDEFNSVIESGLIPLSAFAQALGTTNEQVRKSAEGGKITTAVILEAARITGEKAAPAAEEAGKKAEGAFNRWGNAVKRLRDAFAQPGGLLDILTQVINKSAEALTAAQKAVEQGTDKTPPAFSNPTAIPTYQPNPSKINLPRIVPPPAAFLQRGFEAQKELPSFLGTLTPLPPAPANALAESQKFSKELDELQDKLKKYRDGTLAATQAEVLGWQQRIKALNEYFDPLGKLEDQQRKAEEAAKKATEAQKKQANETARAAESVYNDVVRLSRELEAQESKQFYKELGAALEVVNKELERQDELARKLQPGGSGGYKAIFGDSTTDVGAYSQFGNFFAPAVQPAKQAADTLDLVKAQTDLARESFDRFSESLVKGGDAFGSFAQAVIKGLQQIAAQELSKYLFKSFLGLTGLGGGFTGASGSSELGSFAGITPTAFAGLGSVPATALPAADSIPSIFTSPAGGLDFSGATFLGGLKAGGYIQHKASGGLFSGPGTGTSDSIPAYVSNGEYLLPADTTRRLSVRALDRLRAGESGASVFAGGAGGGGDINVYQTINTPDANSFRKSRSQIAREQAIDLDRAKRRNG
ncbi:tape measure protein [Gloeobacter kilaueensis]|uniref:Mu-like prophage protein n=1 Tax=Gloeobacter kilaueensis (strain ATCC BAA-2537 / CCAP 1431/1 / ULC 316 / JS1) TaxID=1183438 RepID=U5QHP6_GLOK1|nr:tape measure protein [Gloeobacter kilaueensis]AGY57154.1 Mu-like prophage protein [Gloeobacter kilaueensis JS1]